mmetsp:Transcript_26652/g.19979  ORF Transcript_26652/g.19979 Transcript_26652/m.19979 type:complete len:86 (-) Transcript_26652:919-1176(-)
MDTVRKSTKAQKLTNLSERELVVPYEKLEPSEGEIAVPNGLTRSISKNLVSPTKRAKRDPSYYEQGLEEVNKALSSARFTIEHLN